MFYVFVVLVHINVNELCNGADYPLQYENWKGCLPFYLKINKKKHHDLNHKTRLELGNICQMVINPSRDYK